MTVHEPKVLILAAVTSAETLPALLAPDLAKAAVLARQEKATATRRAYASDVAIFGRCGCTTRGVSPLPAMPETVAAFLAWEVERGIRPSTIGRRVAAIRYAHKLAGHAVGSPRFAAALRLEMCRASSTQAASALGERGREVPRLSGFSPMQTREIKLMTSSPICLKARYAAARSAPLVGPEAREIEF